MGWAEMKWIEQQINESIDKKLVGGYQLFTESGTFDVPKGINEVYISAVAGGGGAGGGGAVFNYYLPNRNQFFSSATGGCGGAGEYVKDYVISTQKIDSFNVYIESGGIGGAGGTKYIERDPTPLAKGKTGEDGGTVSVGNFLILKGGEGGEGGIGAEQHQGYSGEKITQREDCSIASGSTTGNISVDGTLDRSIGGKGGRGSVNGIDGLKYYKVSDTNYEDKIKDYYAVLTRANPNVFSNLFGYGGKAYYTKAEQDNVWKTGTKGEDGGKGAVLVCWGNYKHDKLFNNYIVRKNEKNESTTLPEVDEAVLNTASNVEYVLALKEIEMGLI